MDLDRPYAAGTFATLSGSTIREPAGAVSLPVHRDDDTVPTET